MQSSQLRSTPTIPSRRIHERLACDADRAALADTSHGLQYGRDWLWNGTGESYTAAGLERLAGHLDAAGYAQASAVVLECRAELLTREAPAAPAPAAPAAATMRAMRPARSHLPYADADDAQIFANLAAEQGDHSHAIRH